MCYFFETRCTVNCATVKAELVEIINSLPCTWRDKITSKSFVSCLSDCSANQLNSCRWHIMAQESKKTLKYSKTKLPWFSHILWRSDRVTGNEVGLFYNAPEPTGLNKKWTQQSSNTQRCGVLTSAESFKVIIPTHSTGKAINTFLNNEDFYKLMHTAFIDLQALLPQWLNTVVWDGYLSWGGWCTWDRCTHWHPAAAAGPDEPNPQADHRAIRDRSAPGLQPTQSVPSPVWQTDRQTDRWYMSTEGLSLMLMQNVLPHKLKINILRPMTDK